MEKLIFSILFLLAWIFSTAQNNSLGESINAFSFKLFEQIYTSNENCFYSPYSIYGALSMTGAGAEGNTKLEMEKTLEIENDKNAPHEYQKLVELISANNNYKLLTSNSLWLDKSLKLKKSYSKLTDDYYHAKCKNVDFVDEGNREKARIDINEWVEKQTNKKIQNFIQPGVLTESTGMVLINAVYFNALWEKSFITEETNEDDFLAASGDSVQCEMMNTLARSNYYEDEMVQAVEIAYKGKAASMIIIMPRTNRKANVNEIDYKYFSDIIRSFETKDVRLSFPKFKMDVDYELSTALKLMGMKSAFTKEADFSNITGEKDLIISNVLHKSIIEVSEEGTEASSTTAVISMRSASVGKDLPVIFKADHPFLFVIKENNTNTILFMGYMAQPSGFESNNKIPKVQSRD